MSRFIMPVIFVLGTVGAIGYGMITEAKPLTPTYSMTMEYRDNSYVIDHGMTLTDCFDNLPRNDPFHKLGFACVLED